MSENCTVLSSATYKAWRRRILLQLDKDKLGIYADLDGPPNEATTSLTVINYKAARAIILGSVDDDAIELTQPDDSPKKILETFEQNFSKPSKKSSLDLNNRPINQATIAEDQGSIIFRKDVIHEEEKPESFVQKGNQVNKLTLAKGKGSTIEYCGEVKNLTKIIPAKTTLVPAQQPNDDSTLQEDGKIEDFSKKVIATTTQVPVAAASRNPTTTTATNYLDGRNLEGVILAIESNVKAGNIKTERIGPAEEKSANSIRDSVISKSSRIDVKGWHSKQTIVEPTTDEQQQQQQHAKLNQEIITFLVKGKQIPIERKTLAQKAPDFEVSCQNGNEFEIKEDGVDPVAFEVMLDFFKDREVIIKPEFAINLLLVADDFKAESLKEHVFKYINNNCLNIESTDDFGNLRKRPHLLENFNRSKSASNENIATI